MDMHGPVERGFESVADSFPRDGESPGVVASAAEPEGVTMSPQGGALPDTGEFVRRTEPFRRELLAHCYRMLGSLDDAEDLVQETYLRAWRAYDGFEGRSSVRSWLYRIATNACLTARQHRGRRPLPSGLGGPGADPAAPLAAVGSEVTWLQPMPDALVTPASDDPAAIVASRESLRLALIASLQYLTARQRVVLLLRDVLAWPAAEVAALLGTTTAAVKSTLQRARARLEPLASAADQVTEPTAPEVRALLDQYIAAFENADATALEQLLRQDATLEMTPFKTWFAGKKTCVAYLTTQVLGSPGDWRMLPTSANGQPAVVAYLRGSDGAHHAFGAAVLTLTATGIARIVVFGDPGLVARFGLPSVLPTNSSDQ
jgi:RNA polymerase sigma-70 factor (ECF subfamily)